MTLYEIAVIGPGFMLATGAVAAGLGRLAAFFDRELPEGLNLLVSCAVAMLLAWVVLSAPEQGVPLHPYEVEADWPGDPCGPLPSI